MTAILLKTPHKKTGSSELAETAKMQREKLRAQLDKFFTICQRLCDNEQSDVANELPKILLLYAITALTHMETRCSTKMKIR